MPRGEWGAWEMESQGAQARHLTQHPLGATGPPAGCIGPGQEGLATSASVFHSHCSSKSQQVLKDVMNAGAPGPKRVF